MTDVIWLLPALAGVALGLLLRSRVLALLLGFGLVVISFVLFGYSFGHYSEYDCQPGEPCPTGEQIVGVAETICFLLGAPLFLIACGRDLWVAWRDRGAWRRRRA